MSVDLLVRLPNWVGDVCTCLPALDALRASGATLTCYGRDWAPNVLAGYDATVVTLPKGIRNDAQLMRKQSALDIILFPNSFSSAASAKLAGKKSIGYAGDWRRFLLTYRIKRGPGEHKIERFWWLAKAAAERLHLDTHCFMRDVPNPILPLTETSQQQAHELLGDEAAQTIVICPMAVGTINGRPKRWPHFSAATEALADRGWRLVCCPGPDEEQECRRSLPRAKMLCGLDLQIYAAVMALAKGVLANDSGPMHLAAAVGGTVLGIYGVSDPQRYRPWGGATIGSADAWPESNRVVERLLQAIDPPPLQPGNS